MLNYLPSFAVFDVKGNDGFSHVNNKRSCMLFDKGEHMFCARKSWSIDTIDNGAWRIFKQEFEQSLHLLLKADSYSLANRRPESTDLGIRLSFTSAETS